MAMARCGASVPLKTNTRSEAKRQRGSWHGALWRVRPCHNKHEERGETTAGELAWPWRAVARGPSLSCDPEFELKKVQRSGVVLVILMCCGRGGGRV